MGKKPPLTCECYISMSEDAEPVPFETLTQEQRAQVFESWSKRLSANLSCYYRQHPEEFEKLEGVIVNEN